MASLNTEHSNRRCTRARQDRRADAARQLLGCMALKKHADVCCSRRHMLAAGRVFGEAHTRSLQLDSAAIVNVCQTSDLSACYYVFVRRLSWEYRSCACGEHLQRHQTEAFGLCL